MDQISPYQNFPGIQSMIFSKRTIRTTSIPKIRKIQSGVWRLQAKNSQNCQFWPKNGKILVLNGQDFAISEFSRHIEYDFLKDDHKNNFYTNKTKYDWFPGKCQNSKKFSANLSKIQQRLKIIGRFLTFWHNKFWGSK